MLEAAISVPKEVVSPRGDHHGAKSYTHFRIGLEVEIETEAT